jgi:hypothetical protein
MRPVSMPVMNMLGYRYMIRPNGGISSDPKSLMPDRMVLVNGEALPRVYLPGSRVVVEDGARCLEKLKDPAFDPQKVVYLEPESADGYSALKTVEEAHSGSGAAAIDVDMPSNVVVHLNMDAAGTLVLADAWYPGWKAYVNGEETQIWIANHMLRAVPVPAGEVTVEFVYDPWSFKLGVILMVVTGVLLGAWCWRE